MTGWAFVLGLVAGVLGGFMVATFSVGVPLLGPLAILIGCLARPRPAGAGGTLVGWGTTWLVLFTRVAVNRSGEPDGGGGSDVSAWVAAGVVLIVVGFALAAAAYHRGHGRPPEPS